MDILLTNIDVLLIHIDILLASIDILITNIYILLTHTDVLPIHIHILLINIDISFTNIDILLTHLYILLTYIDLLPTHIDISLTHVDILLTTDVNILLTHIYILRTCIDVMLTQIDISLTHINVLPTHIETPNYMLLGKELCLPDKLISDRLEPVLRSKVDCTPQLSGDTHTAHEKLRNEQGQVRVEDSQETPVFQVGDKVWLRSKRAHTNKGTKLLPKVVGFSNILQVNEYHVYLVEQ